MAPEYVFHGFFSVKTDVYSFGVLVLEMITGRKSYDVHNEEYSEDLLSFVSIYSPNKLQCGLVHHPVKKCLYPQILVKKMKYPLNQLHKIHYLHVYNTCVTLILFALYMVKESS